jgi:hypothetical protein
MSSASAALYVSGATVEFVGIVLAASPDLVPQGRRLSAWIGARVQRAISRALRLIGRPRVKTAHLGLASEVNLADSMSAVKSVAPDATLERKVQFLLTRDQEAQRDVNDLRDRLAAVERRLRAGLDAVREETRTHVAGELERAHAEYLPLRLLGVFLIVVGLTCATLANFV